MQNEKIKKKILDLIKNGLNKDELLRKDMSPSLLNQEFDFSVNNNGLADDELVAIIDQIIDKSVNTDHPFFMNQMYGKMNPISVYGDIFTTLLNTSMYTYEVAPLLTLIEKECIDKLSENIWGNKNGDGVFTPGGSISNMKGLMLARNAKIDNVKKEGLNNNQNYSVFISDQAHYSFLKAGVMLGFGSDSVIKVKSNERGQLIVSELLSCIEEEKTKGRIPLMLVGVAGTTFSGVFDELDMLADIAKTNDMWYHVDAVYGGSLMFSEKEKSKFNGIELADSVSWNLHKVMGVPLVCSTFLTKEQGLLNEAFAVDADYLFHDDADLDLGQKSIQCGRRVDALKLWLAWKYDGDNGFSHRIDALMNAVTTFSDQVNERDNIEMLCVPETPIAIFRLRYKDLTDIENDNINKALRNEIFKEGKMLFNYSEFNDTIYLRCVISDPDIKEEEISALLDCIQDVATLLKKNQSLFPSKCLIQEH